MYDDVVVYSGLNTNCYGVHIQYMYIVVFTQEGVCFTPGESLLSKAYRLLWLYMAIGTCLCRTTVHDCELYKIIQLSLLGNYV